MLVHGAETVRRAAGDLAPRKLTEANVRDLPDADGRGYVVRDIEIKGFMVIVNKGSRSWVVQRDLWQGPRGNRRLVRTVRYTIGRVGIMPLRIAREQAHAIVAQIQQGIDPNQQTKVTPLTLRRAWAEYEEALIARRRSPRTIEDFQYNLKYFQDWADQTLQEVGEGRAKVRDRHKRITFKNGPYAANRAMRWLRSAYNLAIKVYDGLPPNPVIAVTFNRERRRNDALSPEALNVWWQSIHALPNPIRRDLHLFMLFTGMRRSAAVTARWEHVDWERAHLFVPKPKGGEDRAFVLPLSTFLLALLKRRKIENEIPFEGSPWIWPADSTLGHVSEPKETKRGLPPPHALRHSFASFAKAAGLGQMDIALLMNHKLPGVTGGYIHETALFDHLRVCQEHISDHIVSLVGQAPHSAQERPNGALQPQAVKG